MVLLTDLLSAPGLRDVRHLAGPLDARPVTGARLETRREGLVQAPGGSLVVLTAPVPGLLLDVALREAAAAGAAAVVLTAGHGTTDMDGGPGTPAGTGSAATDGPPADRGAPPPLPATVRALAERGRVALLAADGDLAALVVAVERAVAGDAADALARVSAAAAALPGVAGDPAGAAQVAARALGVPVEVRLAGPGEAGASAAGPDGEVRLAAPLRASGHTGQAVRSVLAMAALAAAGGGRGDVPVRSRGRLLAEILVAPRERTARLAARGRALGLPVDGHHIALRLETGGPGERYEALEPVMSEALILLRDWSAGDTEAGAPAIRWNAALADEALILLATWQIGPGPEERRRLGDDVRRLAGRLERDHPAALRCGVGGAHRGVLGIRATAREAAAALLRDPAAPVVVHDAAGLDRMLTEWYASDSAREAVKELLAPVLALGPERAGPLVRTLQAYLDHNNSPARAAEALHLHRNAVGARIRRVTELTGADLADPEVRLALQLACRAVAAGAGPAGPVPSAEPRSRR
ncbi:PucR family transcriptional regulator [Streptomyces sp. NPDC015220]|uniref:PucR family transcriptional regulator n=1 Tax=Streptomyces sp. NPDC015220 TaxID=3364947 RepID=UPI0036FF4874